MDFTTILVLVVLWTIGPNLPAPTESLCRAPVLGAGSWRSSTVSPEQAFDRIMEYEGGSNIHEVPGDPGGLTKWGVSQRAYPHLAIPNITRTRALEIFTNDYWTPVRAESLPESLRLPVADFAFNAGVGMATRTLQQAVNLCKQAYSRRDLLEVDGKLGPLTMGSLDDYPPERLALVFLAYRIDHYMKLAEAGRSKFIYGWLKRASEIHHYGGNA